MPSLLICRLIIYLMIAEHIFDVGSVGDRCSRTVNFIKTVPAGFEYMFGFVAPLKIIIIRNVLCLFPARHNLNIYCTSKHILYAHTCCSYVPFQMLLLTCLSRCSSSLPCDPADPPPFLVTQLILLPSLWSSCSSSLACDPAAPSPLLVQILLLTCLSSCSSSLACLAAHPPLLVKLILLPSLWPSCSSSLACLAAHPPLLV